MALCVARTVQGAIRAGCFLPNGARIKRSWPSEQCRPTEVVVGGGLLLNVKVMSVHCELSVTAPSFGLGIASMVAQRAEFGVGCSIGSFDRCESSNFVSAFLPLYYPKLPFVPMALERRCTFQHLH